MATMTKDARLKPKGYLKMTSLGTAVGFTSVPAGSQYALIKTEGQTVRWRDDGNNPTTTDGMLIDVGDEFWYTGNDLSDIKFIETAASATLHVSFYS